MLSVSQSIVRETPVLGASDEAINSELKACMILERLHDRLHGATVDYQRHRGKHEFAIRYAGFRFVVRFPEQTLLRKGVQELEQAAAQIVERIRLNAGSSSPRVSRTRR